MDLKSWLRTVLQHYQDPNRTFRDVDAVLQTYLSLKPKMDHYTTNDGNTQLLLCLHGTIPITYRSIPYNIPVAFWVPREYPNVSPIPFVKPTANMLIREGRHVDKTGMFYHQYRSSWSSDPKYTFLELVAILQQVFAQEPPVYTKPISHPPSMPTASPQMDRPSPSQQRQSLPSQPVHTNSPSLQTASPDMSRWTADSTLLNQGLASLNLNTSSPSLPKANVITTPSFYPQIPTNSLPNADKNRNSYSPQDRLYKKIADRLQQYNMSISGDMDKMLLQSRQLNEGQMNIEQEYRALNDIKERLKYNDSVLETKLKEIDQVTVKVDEIPDVQVDEALCGTTVVANQLFDLVAEDNAISDTVYFLSKALNSERIDLATFMKYTRMLSREQFMKRALIKKITQA